MKEQMIVPSAWCVVLGAPAKLEAGTAGHQGTGTDSGRR